MIQRAASVVLFAACAASGAACTHAQARTAPAPPALDVPPPPPRVVEVNGGDQPTPPVGLIIEPAQPAQNPPARPRPPVPPPARPDPPKTDVAKPEQPPAEPPRIIEEPKAPPAATLQIAPTQQELELEGRIRTQLGRATADLNRINPQTMGANTRTQYDAARGFIKQADEALKAKNYPFAGSLADKAAALAAQLAGR